MKLEMFLDVAMDDKDIVAIGTEGGSCFIYFGEAGNRDLINKAFSDINRIRTNVMHRDIVRAYRKEVDDCVAIILEGSEVGKIWTKEEFDKKYKKMLGAS